MYSIEWERSREDSYCMLEDGSQILGYKAQKDHVEEISSSKDDDTDSITKIICSIFDWKLQIISRKRKISETSPNQSISQQSMNSVLYNVDNGSSVVICYQ